MDLLVATDLCHAHGVYSKPITPVLQYSNWLPARRASSPWALRPRGSETELSSESGTKFLDGLYDFAAYEDFFIFTDKLVVCIVFRVES